MRTSSDRDNFVRLDIGSRTHPLIERTEVLVAVAEQLLEAVDNEIGLLEIIDDVSGPHDAFEVEAEPVGRRIFEREHGFGRGRHDAGAEDAQTLGCLHETELDRVPVEAGEIGELPELQRPPPALAVGFEKIGKFRHREHRHMAEHVVENVGFFEIVEFALGSDKGACRKAPTRQKIEERLIGDEPGYRHDVPAGECGETPAQLAEVRNARPRQLELGQGGEVLITGASGQQSRLPRIEAVPPVVLL